MGVGGGDGGVKEALNMVLLGAAWVGARPCLLRARACQQKPWDKQHNYHLNNHQKRRSAGGERV